MSTIVAMTTVVMAVKMMMVTMMTTMTMLFMRAIVVIACPRRDHLPIVHLFNMHRFNPPPLDLGVTVPVRIAVSHTSTHCIQIIGDIDIAAEPVVVAWQHGSSRNSISSRNGSTTMARRKIVFRSSGSGE